MPSFTNNTREVNTMHMDGQVIYSLESFDGYHSALSALHGSAGVNQILVTDSKQCIYLLNRIYLSPLLSQTTHKLTEHCYLKLQPKLVS